MSNPSREERDAIRARVEAVNECGEDLDAPWSVWFSQEVSGGPYILEVLDRHNDVLVDLSNEAELELAEFIAGARTDVPQLLDALETAEAELAAFHAECDKVFIPHDAEGLVRHHRNNAAFAAACESEARALRAESLVRTLGSALQAIKADRPSVHSDAVWEQLNAALSQFQEFQSALAPTQPEGGSE